MHDVSHCFRTGVKGQKRRLSEVGAVRQCVADCIKLKQVWEGREKQYRDAKRSKEVYLARGRKKDERGGRRSNRVE